MLIVLIDPIKLSNIRLLKIEKNTTHNFDYQIMLVKHLNCNNSGNLNYPFLLMAKRNPILVVTTQPQIDKNYFVHQLNSKQFVTMLQMSYQ